MGFLKNNSVLYPLFKGLLGLGASEIHAITSKAAQTMELRAYPTNVLVRVLKSDDRTDILSRPIENRPWWSYTSSWNAHKDDFFQALADTHVICSSKDSTDEVGLLFTSMRKVLDTLLNALDPFCTISEIVIVINDKTLEITSDGLDTQLKITLKD